MAPSKSTELAIVEASDYPALFGGDIDVAEVMAENFGGPDALGPNDLEQVKIPAGGATTWELPSLEGPVAEKTLTGIILARRSTRRFWQESLDDADEASAPDCASDDAITGRGLYGPSSTSNPSGSCKGCPMSQWGSGSEDGNDRGPQACKENWLLYVLRPGSVLPTVLSLPPTSLKACKQYMVQLSQAAKPMWAVVTSIGLKAETSGKLKYSTATFQVDSQVDPAHLGTVKEFAATVKAIGEPSTPVEVDSSAAADSTEASS